MPAHLHLASDTQGPRPGVPITVVLAVNHPAARRSLRRLLDLDERVEVIAEPADVATATRVVLDRAPQVVVVDLRLADGQAGDTVRLLREHSPRTEVIVLTMDESPLTAQQAIDGGAIGFVLKDRADSELLEAIHCAGRGDEFVSPRVGAGLDALRVAAGDGLSPRETEVVRLIALGHTSAEIALKLRVSRRTVETQRARIYDKLGFATRAELVRFALRRHLIGC